MELVKKDQSLHSKYIRHFFENVENLVCKVEKKADLIKIYLETNERIIVVGRHREKQYDIYYVSQLNVKTDKLIESQKETIIKNIKLYFSLYKNE